jgi:hypothetical protein
MLALSSRPADADPGRLAERLAAAGLETVRVSADSLGCRIEMENRRFRDQNFALGVVAALAFQESPGPCEVLVLSQGVPVARVKFDSREWDRAARGELPLAALEEHVGIQMLPCEERLPGAALSPTERRFDLVPRIRLDSQFGHLSEPVLYHLEITPELSTQAWRGALLRVSYALPLPHGNDIPANALEPDYSRSRLGEAALYQVFRTPVGGLGSLSGGYFGANRYGLSVGWGRALGGHAYLDASADVTGSLAFFPEVSYSSMSRVTFVGALVLRPSSPDLVLTLRGGRYLLGQAGSGAGEYAFRAELDRRFHQVEIGAFATQSESNRYGGIHLSVPLPPIVRLRPAAIRPNLMARFPVEYRTDEGQFELAPTDLRLRSDLLDDLWPSAVRTRLDEWIAGWNWARPGAQAGPGGDSK